MPACMRNDMRRQGLESCRREEERQARLQRAREYEDAAWVQPGAEADGGSGDEGEALDVADELYCVACDKFFKTANAMGNHQRCSGPWSLHNSAVALAFS